MNTRPSFSQILGTFQKVAGDTIRAGFSDGGCVAATRITIGVLKNYGIEAVPLSVKLMVVNAAFRAAVESGDVPPSTSAAIDAWSKRTGAWSLGIGVPEDGDESRERERASTIETSVGMIRTTERRWVGHLVAHLPVQNMLVDAAVGDASRPERKMGLPQIAILAGTNRQFLRGKASACGEFYGCTLQYAVQLKNDLWRRSPLWTDTEKTREAVKQIRSDLEKILGT
jgi:hypothetical protein